MAEERKSEIHFKNSISLCVHSVYHVLVTTSALVYLTEAVQNPVHVMEQKERCMCVQPKGGKKICSPGGCGEYR